MCARCRDADGRDPEPGQQPAPPPAPRGMPTGMAGDPVAVEVVKVRDRNIEAGRGTILLSEHKRGLQPAAS